MATNVFTYGTLMFSEIVHSLTGKNFKTKNAVLKGYQRFSVSDPDRDPDSKSPVIVKTEGNSVQGKLYLDVDKETIDVFDKNEDEYEKKNVEVLVGGEKVKAIVYISSKFAKKHLVDDWDPDEFRSKHLHAYLTRIIPQRLKKWSMQ